MAFSSAEDQKIQSWDTSALLCVLHYRLDFSMIDKPEIGSLPQSQFDLWIQTNPQPIFSYFRLFFAIAV
jgi:hypothetical protein